MIIRVTNNLTEGVPVTFLSGVMGTGTAVIPWRSANGFSPSWAVQLGETGEEQSEILVLGTAAVANAAGTATGNSIFFHAVDTPVYAIKYDKVVFKCSTSGTAGTATAITAGTTSVDAGNNFTQFDHTAGLSTYAYKSAWYNSVLDVSTSDSDWMTSAGLQAYSLGKIRDRIKGKLPSALIVKDEAVNDWINEWMEKMTNTIVDVNQDYSIGTADIGFSGTAQEGTITSEDFKYVRRAWYTEDSSTWYQMTKQEYTDFFPEEDFQETHPYFYMRGDEVIGRNPHANSGTIRLSYYKLNATLDSDGDLLPPSMRGYTESFVKWGLAQAYRMDKMIKEATDLEALAEIDRVRLKSEIAPRHKSGPSYIKIVEDWGDDNITPYW